MEDLVLVPEHAVDLEREPLVMLHQQDVDRDTLDARRSLGQMLETSSRDEVSAGPKPGKLDKLAAGQMVAYAADKPSKSCSVGKVWTITRAEAAVVVQRHKPASDGRLRVKWRPVFLADAEAGGHEVLDSGDKPSLEKVPVKRIICQIQLHDGVMSHAAARKLDKA